jgi:hypothetical protein
MSEEEEEEEETEREEIKDETHELEDEIQDRPEPQTEDVDASVLPSDNEKEEPLVIENEQPEEEIPVGQDFETEVLKEKEEENTIDVDKLPVEEQLAEVREDNKLLQQKRDEHKQSIVRRKKESGSHAADTVESKNKNKKKVLPNQKTFTTKILKQFEENERQLEKIISLTRPLQKYFLLSQKQLQAVKVVQSHVKQLQSQIYQIQREIKKLAAGRGKIGLRHKATKQNKKR